MSQHLRSKKRNPDTGLPTYSPSEDERSGDGSSADETASSNVGKYEKLSDQELLEWIVQRKKEALETLYSRFADAVFSLAMHMLHDSGAAEEVAQDTFLKIWRRASSYRPDRGKVSTWLFSIAHHRVIDEVRKRRRRDQSQVFQDVDLMSQPADDSADPSRYAAAQLQRSLIGDALATLRPEQREVVILAYYGGFTHVEIASKLQQPLGTVKTRMHLALKKLRLVLSSREQEWKNHEL